MNSAISQFLERLAERLVALVGGVVTSRIAALHAESVAGLLSELEDEARKYEAADKPEIAAELRKRAHSLTLAANTSDVTEMVRKVSDESNRLGMQLPENPRIQTRVPDFGAQPLVKPKKNRHPNAGAGSNEPGEIA